MVVRLVLYNPKQYKTMEFVRTILSLEQLSFVGIPIRIQSINMYNVNITGSFGGVFPSTISISSRSHSAAVRHYKSALQARQVSTGSRVVLQSAFGFKFRVDASSSSSRNSSIRLALPSNINREAVARALSSNSSRPKLSRAGVVAADPFGVTWMLV